MSAAGKVCIGFSLPYVAKYSANGGTPRTPAAGNWLGV